MKHFNHVLMKGPIQIGQASFIKCLCFVCTVVFFQTQAVDLRSGEVMVLSPDIVQFISDTKLNMLMVQINDMSVSQSDGLESGNLHVKVIDVVSSKELQVGQLLSIPFQRAVDEKARDSQAFNAWNTVSLVRNSLLVLGLKVSAEPDEWSAYTGSDITNTNDPMLVALRQAYKIESFKGADEQRQELLRESLINKHSLLRFYSIKVLTERGWYKRKVSFNLLSSALEVKKIDEDFRLDLGRSLLSDELLNTSLRNDEVNTEIVSEISKQMLRTDNDLLRIEWSLLLASAILRSFDDDEILDVEKRHSLVARIKEPSRNLVIESLRNQIAGLDFEETEAQQELLNVWLKAK